MTDTERLKSAISDAGITIKWLAEQLGISREGLYNKICGKTEFKASEVVALTQLLHLNPNERDGIFFAQ